MKIIILAGGKGSRFWPRSVESKPKQFLAIHEMESLLQQTYHRFNQFIPVEDIYVVTARRYVDLVTEQLPDLHPDRILIEPYQRDTGPCIAFTALHFLNQGIDEVLVTAPSDQYIADGQALFDALNEAVEIAGNVPAIATLGIVPTRPETGYGYIHSADKPIFGNVYPVRQFIEKPSLEAAEELLKNQFMFWNSGIFVWRPSTIAFYMKKYQENLWHALSSVLEAGLEAESASISDIRRSSKPASALESIYKHLPTISIDYAILEKAEEVYTIPVHFTWDDVGTWSSLLRFSSPDSQGNHFQGSIYSLDSSDNIVFSDKKTIIIGVHDLIIVSTKEGLLVCSRSDEHLIKHAINLSGISSPRKEV